MKRIGTIFALACIMVIYVVVGMTGIRRANAQTAATNGNSYVHIPGASTGTQVSTIGQTLHTVVVNTAGTSVTLYDNASACSGSVVAAIGAVAGTFTYDLKLNNGLCVVTVGSGSDVTVTVR